MKFRSQLPRSAVAGILTAFAAQAALAGNVNTDLIVTATVAPTCRASTTPVAFGNIDITLNQAFLATGGLSVTCTAGTAWEAGINEGQGLNATNELLNMTGAQGNMNYNLYTDAARTTKWQDPGSANVMAGMGTGSAQLKTVYGKVATGQTTLPAGNYADTVIVTVTY